MTLSTTADLPTMTSAELRGTTETLGLPVAWLADEWGVRQGDVKRWMHSGTHPIPDWVTDDVRQIVDDTSRAVADLVEQAKAGVASKGTHLLRTFRNDAEIRNLPPDNPAARYTAAWHRNVCAQVVKQVPGVRVLYYFRAKPLRERTSDDDQQQQQPDE